MWCVGGRDLKEAFEWCAVALFGYMVNLDKVEVLEETEREISVSGKPD